MGQIGAMYLLPKQVLYMTQSKSTDNNYTQGFFAADLGPDLP